MYYWDEFIKDINKTIKEGSTVFDAGAGDGHWRKHLPEKINYISMDLGVGDASVDYSHLDIKGDLRSIPLADESVDVIISIQVLEHLPEPWVVLKEFNRILKKGGYIFASCPQGEPQHQVPYDFYRYTVYGLESIFRISGFQTDFIIPQTGNFAKINNDILHSAEILKKEKKTFLYAFLRLTIKLNKFIFYKFDKLKIFQTNTVGHFVKAHRP